MAHPMFIRRFDRRTWVAAGTTAAVLATPALAVPAQGAVAVDQDVPAVDAAPAVVPQATDLPVQHPDPDPDEESPSGVDALLPEALQEAADPIGKVVDDVLRGTPAPVQEAVEQLPAVEQVPEAVGGLVDGAPVPADPTGVVPDGVAAPIGPEPDVGTASSPPAARRGLPQGPGIPAPPFRARGVRSDTTTTRPPRPFAPPVMSGTLFGDLPRRAEEFLSRAPSASSDALAALRGSATTTAPSPDAASWLLATAAGMLLLVGAGHVVHARQRYVASVAR